MSDPVTYSDAMLGKANDLYCQQIMDPNVWGGGVELSILASNYNVEIVAIDISTLHAYHFGQSIGTSERVFLLYSGIHYDAVALSPLADAPQEFDETMFSVHDASMLAKAVRLASDLKKVISQRLTEE
jgi:ubiquitin thioesterase OTU1